MIDAIMELLRNEEFLGMSEAIDIAKGKYKLYDNYKEIKQQKKRAEAWQLKKQ